MWAVRSTPSLSITWAIRPDNAARHLAGVFSARTEWRVGKHPRDDQASGRRQTRMRAGSDEGDVAPPDHPAPTGNGDETAALDELLRDERAAVTVTVALANGATTYAGRTQLERLGGELVLLCAALRERLDLAGHPVPSGASPEAGMMLATESYDARLAALADFLDAAAARATEALAASNDAEYTRTLRDLIPAHAQVAQWLRERAAAFAATRPLSDTANNPDTLDQPADPARSGETPPEG